MKFDTILEIMQLSSTRCRTSREHNCLFFVFIKHVIEDTLTKKVTELKL